ncbi:MAG: hypothetical protein MMC33_010124 [Icmadophila ericetorum]|nr:hypothetical protein [Icmadophila ericetorum]
MTTYRQRLLAGDNDSPMIRLLQLAPGDGSDTIRCSIRYQYLKQDIKYEALSYCWGDPTITKPILVENAPLKVTENLYLAFQHIRFKDRPRLLWIDAICINQADTEEKNAQVRLMRRIYQGAAEVLIWLGKAADNSDAAFELIRRLVFANDYDSIYDIRRLYLWDNVPKLFNLPPTTERVWYDMFGLLRRPWFSRAWVIQEVAVASKAQVICGRETSSWKNFAKAFMYVGKVGHGVTFGADAIEWLAVLEAARERHLTSHKESALQVLLRHRQAMTTDPRDKIFAFHGILNQPEHSRFTFDVDYRIPTAEVYKKLAIGMLCHDQTLDILSVAHVCEKSNVSGLPSWIPDWSTPESTASLLEMESEGQVRYNATASSQYTPVFKRDNTRLRLEGYLVDRILLISEMAGNTMVVNHVPTSIAESAPQFIQQQKVLQNWENVAGARVYWRKYALTGESIIDAYWQTLVAGRMFGPYEDMKKLHERWYNQMAKFRVLQVLRLDRLWLFQLLCYITVSICMIAQFFNLPSLIQWVMPNPESIFLTLCSPVKNRRIVLTDHRMIGLVPGSAQDDDFIALFKGGRLPLVVRPKDGDWELVGDCYMHGIMAGQIWDEKLCQEMWFV